MKSIQGRISVLAGACLLGSVISIVAYSVVSEGNTRSLISQRVGELTQTNTVESLKNLAWAHAGVIQSKFDLALNAARTMAHTFEVGKKSGGLGRDQINDVLYHVLVNNPEFNGTYSNWEPNALDGKDAAFQTGRDGNNAQTGRFTPYWNRGQDGKIAVQSLVEYDTMDRHPNGVLKGGWYIGPRENHQESVLDPFPYIVQGKSVWLTTLSVPIMLNKRFVGVAGTDYNLDFVQKLAVQADQELFEGKGGVTIISNAGLVVADSEHPERIGQAFSASKSADDSELLKNVQEGRAKGWFDESNKHMKAVAPITLGRTGKPWAVLVSVPQGVVLAQAQALDQEIQARGTSSTIWQILVGLLVTAVATALLWFVAGNIARPVRAAADFARAVLAGDFSRRFQHESNDEVGQLARALDEMSQSLLSRARLAEQISEGNLDMNVRLASEHDQLGLALRQMLDGLNSLVSELKGGAGRINNNAGRVTSLSNTLSDGSARSAESVTQIAASIEQVSEQIKLNAQNATNAEQSSAESRDAARAGSQHMTEMMDAMVEMRVAGERINDIINAINEITMQTNLLALNAAIEAARAGEHGRGFAVVADEVRKLASNSSDAASQAAKLIGESAAKTARSIEIAGRTAETLNGIVISAERVSALITSIAEASQQQALAIDEVNVGLAQIDGVTRRTSDTAEDCKEAAEELLQQAEHLNGLVGRFRSRGAG
ncbi:methyl-accepting chemotaxis protein [Azonexus caeni]|jgi:methyl-accepting chemotaxis protein|uniref:methyl-accepting chemotaxis protein n=1 Tax=Azonexus caeni TaxID=266126 RepID=UPI003A8B79BC